MIIGISSTTGPQSGKDTVGKIFRYLSSGNLEDYNPDLDYSYYSNLAIKKFAEPLKKIVSILTGYSLEDLEKEEIKKTKLGPEWDVYVSVVDLVTVKIFGTFKEAEDYNRDLFKELKLRKNPSDFIYLKQLTVRDLLRLIGTDLFREKISPNIWINALLSKYTPFDKGGFPEEYNFLLGYHHKACKSCKKPFRGFKRQYLCKECIKDNSVQFYPNWIITDLRFKNEFKAIKLREGVIINVINPRVKNDTSIKSESELQDVIFDYTIVNDSTLESLVEKVKIIYNEIKHLF